MRTLACVLWLTALAAPVAAQDFTGVFGDGEMTVEALCEAGVVQAAVRLGDEVLYAEGRLQQDGAVEGGWGPAGLEPSRPFRAQLDGALLVVITDGERRLTRTSDALALGQQRAVRGLAQRLHPALDQALGLIARAQARYREQEGAFGALDELTAARALDGAALGRLLYRCGYVVDIHPSPRTPARAWLCAASPDQPGRPWFLVTHEGQVLRAAAPLPLDYQTCAAPEGAARTDVRLDEAQDAEQATGPKTLGPDLSHVAVGQKYVYEMNQAGMKLRMQWEVKEITAAAIKCDHLTFMDMGQGMQAIGPPAPLEYPLAPQGVAPMGVQPQGDITFETVQAAGRGWRCMVTTTGDSKVWTYAPNDVPTFPGAIRMEQGGQVTMVLDRVDGR